MPGQGKGFGQGGRGKGFGGGRGRMGGRSLGPGGECFCPNCGSVNLKKVFSTPAAVRDEGQA